MLHPGHNTLIESSSYNVALGQNKLMNMITAKLKLLP